MPSDSMGFSVSKDKENGLFVLVLVRLNVTEGEQRRFPNLQLTKGGKLL